MDHKTKKSIWNTPISEIIGKFRPEGDIRPPDLGFLIKPILSGVGIFIVVVVGYKLIKMFLQAFQPVTITTTDNSTVTSGVVSLFSNTNMLMLVILLSLPAFYFVLRPFLRSFRDFGD